MGRFEVIEHTADLGLWIEASDLADLFQTAATGLFQVIVANPDAIQPVVSERVDLEAGSTEALLIGWLNELIVRCETTRMLYGRFAVQLDDLGARLVAEIQGEPMDRDRHQLDHEVKAATWHELLVRQSDQGWVARVILDI